MRHISASSTARAVDALLPLIAAMTPSTPARPALPTSAEPDRRTWPRASAPATAFTGPVVLIDGRSGSGKTALAIALSDAWPTDENPTIVQLDDIYPGWSGLDAASAHVHEHLLAAARPRWQRYDWVNARGAEWASVDPNRPLIVEGIGSLSRANVPLATLSVWLQLDTTTRRHRAIARDGAAYEPHWDDWAALEDAFIARENPKALADVVIDVTAEHT